MESYHKGRKIKICNDDGVIFGHLTAKSPSEGNWHSLEIMRGLAENNGRAWLVFDDGSNFVVTPYADEEQ